MKHLLGILVLVSVGAGRVCGGTPEVLDGVAAIVNSNVITYSQVNEYLQPVVQQLRRDYSGDELRHKIHTAQLDALNNLIDRALIVQEYHDKGFTLPETAVDNELNETVTTDFGGDRTAFIKTLEAQHLTLAEYRDQLRDRMIVQAMRTHKVQQAVIVSPHQIEKYYQEHLAQFQVDEQIKLRMIFVKKAPPRADSPPVAGTNAPPASPDAPPAAAATNPGRVLAQEILGKLNEGVSFASLARLYSEGKEGQNGGEYGWISRDVLLKELSAVAFKLKPGQHSQIVEAGEGYYLMQVDEVNPAHTRPISEARTEIEKVLLQQQRTKLQENWVKDLRAKAFIRVF